MRQQGIYSSFQFWMAIIIYISGIGNMYFSKKKPLTDPVHKIWQHYHEFKFVMGMFLTPMIYPLTSVLAEEGEANISEERKIKYQFYILVVFYITSPAIKYFREEICQNFENDRILEKVMQL